MGVPIYMRIQQFIKAKIKTGEWEAGSMIPTEAELSKQFGCSRITVTNALRELVKDGVIYRIQGKGTYVSEKDSAANLYGQANMAQTALSLESMYIPGEHVCTDLRIEKPTEEAAKILKLNPSQMVIAFDRIKYVDSKPFAVENIYLPEVLYAAILGDYSELHLENQEISEISEVCGITIGKSFISSKPVLCEEAVGEQLDIPAGLPILQFQIEVHDMQERPVALYLIYTEGRQDKVLMS